MPEPIHLIMAVWGRPFVDLFLNVSLPSQLAPGNLPALAELDEVLYKIYTFHDDVDYIRSHPGYRFLTKFVKTEIIVVKPNDIENKFSPLIQIHNQAISETFQVDATLIFLSPDFVMASGTIARLIKIRETGYRAAMILTLRLSKLEAIERFKERFYNSEDHAMSASPRQLVNAAMPFLHPIEKTYFWGKNFSSFPIHAYWPAGEDALLARCFYLHPIMIRPLIKNLLPRITIDADYVDLTCPFPSLIYVSRDSDDLTVFELTDGNTDDANAAIRKPFEPNYYNYAKWALVNANPVYNCHLHHWYFQLPIRIHAGATSTSQWEEVEKDSKKAAERIRLWSAILRWYKGFPELLHFLRMTVQKHNDTVSKGKDQTPSEKSNRLENDLGVVFFKTPRRQIVLGFQNDIPGEGWSGSIRASSRFGWRYFDMAHKPCLFLFLETNKDYDFETVLYDFSGSDPSLLRVAVNGEPAAEQYIANYRGKIRHRCVLPQSAVAKKNGRVMIEYELDDSSTERCNCAISRITCKQGSGKFRKGFMERLLSTIAGRVDAYEYKHFIGFGKLGSDRQGCFRGLIPKKSANIKLKVFPIGDYIIKTKLNEVLGENSAKLLIDINNHSLPDETIKALDGVWHVCTVPRYIIKAQKGVINMKFLFLDGGVDKAAPGIHRIIYMPAYIQKWPKVAKGLVRKVIHALGVF